MGWFKRFFGGEYVSDYQEVPFSTITRWPLYDLMLKDPNKVAIDLGLNPVSKEGDDKEREDSDSRLANLEPLLPFIDVTAELTARILSSLQLDELKDAEDPVELDQEDVAVMIAFFKSVAFSSLIAAFSSAIQLGMIHSNVDMEEMQ
jgi:hypothetical protein